MDQHEHFFRTATKHERVATLEAHDSLTLPCRTNHQAIDRLLPDAGAPGPLSDAKTLSPGKTAKRLGIDQGVVQDQIGFFDAPQCAKRPQLGIAGTGSDK
jgi:hypothetical protein